MGIRTYLVVHGLSEMEFRAIEPILTDISRHTTFAVGHLKGVVDIAFFSDDAIPIEEEVKSEKADSVDGGCSSDVEPVCSDSLLKTSWGSH